MKAESGHKTAPDTVCCDPSGASLLPPNEKHFTSHKKFSLPALYMANQQKQIRSSIKHNP